MRRKSGGRRAGCGLDPHFHVDRDHTVLVHDDRIEIHFGDFGKLIGQVTDAQQDDFRARERRRGGRAAVAEQQW